MRKLDLILENIRDEYMINLLEEGEVTELQTLKTKKFLNENLNRIRAMLIEEGAMDAVKQHLGDNWGKYLAGAGALGGAAAGADAWSDTPTAAGVEGIMGSDLPVGDKVGMAGEAIANQAGGAMDQKTMTSGVPAAGAANWWCRHAGGYRPAELLLWRSGLRCRFRDGQQRLDHHRFPGRCVWSDPDQHHV